MNRLLKKVRVFFVVGIVLGPSLFIVLDLRSHSRHKNLVISATKTTKSHQFKPGTNQKLPHEGYLANLQKPEKDTSEIAYTAENIFPPQKTTYESCLENARKVERKEQFHEFPSVGIALYSAFLDYRFKDQAFIRLISFLPAYGEMPQMYCHFMDLNTYEFFSSVVEVEELGTNHGYAYQGFVSSCDLPEQIDSYTLCSVNVSLEPEAQFQTFQNTRVIPLHVVDRRVNTETYSLCVPPISGEISVTRLVEFIELSQILGVSHFTFYNSKATDSTLEILRYYKEKGLVSILPWEVPQYIASNVQDNGRATALNDCLYRNMERFDYVAFNNLDEFIVPLTEDKRTPQIFQSFSDEDAAGYCFQSFTFDTAKSAINNSKTQLFTQIFTSRAKSPTEGLSRCLVSPKKVFSLDLNTITNPSETFYIAHDMEPSFGYVFHYRECFNGERDCTDSYQDLTMQKYQEELEMRFNLTMSFLRRQELA